jgi:tripartite-type tricarboxylate transporter receptor subunit TctC
MKNPVVISQIEKAGLFVDYRDSEETFKLVEQEYAAVAKVVKKSGIGK